LLLLELERYAEALADLDAARADGRDDAFLHAGRGAALERLGRPREAERAFAAAFARARGANREALARLRWVRGFAVAGRAPAAARADFEAVLKDDPANAQALYGSGMLLEREGRPEEALAYYDRAVDASPGFAQARRVRAVLLARQGDWRRAGREINWCLDQEPRGGPTLYAAACVAALTAGQNPRASGQAVAFLRLAFAQGYGRDKVEADRDLDGVRGDPAFRALLAGPARQARR
jgi:tetratricopeptide (TPR) repeat protein